MTRSSLGFAPFAFGAALCGAGCSGGGSLQTQLISAASLPSTASVPVGAQQSVTVRAGTIDATVVVPAASGGSGTIAIAGSATPPPSTLSGTTSVVSVPGIELAYVGFTASASATYATFPTFTFTLPARTNTTNRTFSLIFSDPSFSFSGAGTIVAPLNSSTGASISFVLQPTFFIGSPSIDVQPPLPITLNVGTTYGFALYEGVTPMPSPSPSVAKVAQIAEITQSCRESECRRLSATANDPSNFETDA